MQAKFEKTAFLKRLKSMLKVDFKRMFTMLPMISLLNSTFINVIMCLAVGALIAAGLGAVSNIILKKTSLV